MRRKITDEQKEVIAGMYVRPAIWLAMNVPYRIHLGVLTGWYMGEAAVGQLKEWFTTSQAKAVEAAG